MDASAALSQGAVFYAPQTRPLIAELIARFGETIEVYVVNDPDQHCTALMCRVFRDSSPIRDTIFMVHIFKHDTILRFSRIEIIGNLGSAKEDLVQDIALSCRKAGLRLTFDERMVYGLTEREVAITQKMIPSSYRKKIEGLGIDLRQAQ